jgi:hypothetical protein
MILVSLLLTCGLVIACVSLHYEALRFLSSMQRKRKRWCSNRLRASLLVVGCLIAHTIEVLLFGIGYQFLDFINEGPDLFGTSPNELYCNYYSFVVYTTIGFGDVVPVTPAMRIMTAMEGLTGAILVAWTASFMFFHMQRFWAIESQPDRGGE